MEKETLKALANKLEVEAKQKHQEAKNEESHANALALYVEATTLQRVVLDIWKAINEQTLAKLN